MVAVVETVIAFFLGVFVTGAVAIYRERDDSQEPPIDYEMLIDAVDDALLVVDADGEIRMTNDAFRSLFDVEGVGQRLDDALDAYPGVHERLVEDEEGVVTIERDDGEQYLEVCLYAVEDETDLVLFHDVTARQRQRQKLEEKNEQLDQFASLISHDLRNPLDVAIGRTNAVADMNDDEELDPHLESIRNSLRRMHRIITDVLALARQGEHIGEKTSVSLDSVATDAWSHVKTESATLEVESDMVVMADKDGLEHIFENLFRNAVQHAGDDVTVHVAESPDGQGFFVADDGKGVPADKRDKILEAGYTESDEGTGLGLAIVTSIAEAHGWDVSVTESEYGGAQFEFSSVDHVTNEFVASEHP